jgi:diacylglycerol O-acyltransferase / wax synthase
LAAPAPGSLREVIDIAETMLQSSLDPSGPLRAVSLVEGLDDDRSAVLLHLSHAMSDGIRAMSLFEELNELQRDTSVKPPLPQPIPQDPSFNA